MKDINFSSGQYLVVIKDVNGNLINSQQLQIIK